MFSGKQRGKQEEVDYIIIFHLYKLPIPGNDIDILVILLGNRQMISSEFHVWMELGHFTKNNLHFIDVSNLYTTLGATLKQSIPGFHAFTGCDFTTSFLNKAKKQPLDILEFKSIALQDAFGPLGQTEYVIELTVHEKYVSQMYGGCDITFLSTNYA